jgi:hypothetical protein
MRETARAQFETQVEQLAQIDDPELLRETIDALDEAVATMPEEFAPVVEFVRQRVEERLAQIESEG